MRKMNNYFLPLCAASFSAIAASVVVTGFARDGVFIKMYEENE